MVRPADKFSWAVASTARQEAGATSRWSSCLDTLISVHKWALTVVCACVWMAESGGRVARLPHSTHVSMSLGGALIDVLGGPTGGASGRQKIITRAKCLNDTRSALVCP